MTQADCIRSMNDEELALFLCNIHEPDEDTIVIDDKEFLLKRKYLSGYSQKWRNNMGISKTLNSICIFFIKLKIQIKCMPEEKFIKLLADESLDYTQRLYLCYFRFM